MLRIQTHCEVMAKALNLKEEGGGEKCCRVFPEQYFKVPLCEM